MRDQADEAAAVIGEMDVLLQAAGRRVPPGHVLAEDVDGTRAHDEERAQIPDGGREDVAVSVLAAAQGEGAADCGALLPERAVQPADHLVLPVEMGQGLFGLAGQLQEVVDRPELVAGEAVLQTAGRRARSLVHRLRVLLRSTTPSVGG